MAVLYQMLYAFDSKYGGIEFAGARHVHGNHFLDKSEKITSMDESETSEFDAAARFRHENSFDTTNSRTKKFNQNT